MSLATRSETHLLLGPSASAVHRDQAWDSQVGAYAYLHRKRVSPVLASLGLAVGAATFATYEGIRISADVYAGTRLLLDVPIGIGVGAVSDVFLDHRALRGVRASLWVYAGVAPFVSVTTLRGLGAPSRAEVEFGLKIPFSIVHW